MDFMQNILPASNERWKLTSGSLTEKSMRLPAHATASCALDLEDLAYIPKAFQLKVTHNAYSSWRTTKPKFQLEIFYSDATVATVIWPFDLTRLESTIVVTESIAFVASKTYDSMRFSIINDQENELEVFTHELKPSIDMDETLYNNIEGMLPQLVYAYNPSSVLVPAGVETQIAQLPVSVNTDTHLLLHSTVTGQVASAGVMSCTIKLDGSKVKSFPVRQVVAEGDFYFGIPSLLAFVTAGPHLVTVHLTSSVGDAEVPEEGAILVLDGKGILGGASGEYPHAEVAEQMTVEVAYTDTEQEVSLSYYEPVLYSLDTTITMSNKAFRTDIILERISYGDIISFASFDLDEMPIDNFEENVYYFDFEGLKSITTSAYTSTKEVLEDCTLVTMEVDTTDFDPVYTSELKEVKD